jgi:hypothetical protein
MPIAKEDLACDHYSWNNDSHFEGAPSRRFFDRFNGYQVLFLLNTLHEESERFDLEECRRAEEQILDQMPTDIRSELSAYNWLRGLRQHS